MGAWGNSMKISLSGIAFVGLALAGPAIAADLPRPYYKPQPAYVAPFSWAGFYLGGDIGYSWGKDGLNVSGFDGFAAASALRRTRSCSMERAAWPTAG
jgi:opacity protein-like surface antigen